VNKASRLIFILQSGSVPTFYSTIFPTASPLEDTRISFFPKMPLNWVLSFWNVVVFISFGKEKGLRALSTNASVCLRILLKNNYTSME
jgi:hypothetical protein